KKTSKKRKKKSSAPAAALQPVAPAEPIVPDDGEPPQLTHQPVAAGTRGKPLTIAAHAVDANGVFGPILYVRKRGLGTGDYVPIRMIASKIVPGDYSVDVPAALINLDGLEHYIEAWDTAGNGPTRAGSSEVPMAVAIEEEKRAIALPTLPTNVTIKPKGAPPAITHAALTQALKGKPVEINARLVGDTGVQGATVMFRHAGEKDYKALPMGNIGGDDYTATVPGGMATSDIEYYVEAFDKYGNGPGRSGAPNVPYTIKVLAPQVGEAVTSAGKGPAGPRIVKAPFKPNPGRAAGWLLMGGFVGGLVFAGGEAFASWQANNSYTHTYTYEGRVDSGMLAKANTYGRRAKTAAIVGGISLVGAVGLPVGVPEQSDRIVVGGR